MGVVVLIAFQGKEPLRPAGGGGSGGFDPLAFHADRTADFERAAAAGLSHVLYAKSPGGALATARSTARYRPLVESIARSTRQDPATLEALVFLESAGRPDVVAGSDPANAAGLTQILAETGQNLLGMRIDLRRSRELTRQIATAMRHGRRQLARRLEARRRRFDARFDPRQALAATARYLSIARKRFGRDDLAVTSYHMGIGNLEAVLRAYAGGGEATPVARVVEDGGLSYARVFFDSSPILHRVAYGRLARLGDDSSTYYWRLLAARQIMQLYRSNTPGLARLAALHHSKASAEEVLHPAERTEVFAGPTALAAAESAKRIVALPNDPKRYGFKTDPRMGELSRRLGQPPSTYRGLRREALGLLVYMGAGVRAIAGTQQAPLVVTSTVRDRTYQRLLVAHNREATRAYSLHTSGFAFDVSRRYGNVAEARAFQFMLDRLQALDLIAWVREPEAIHVTVSSAAARLEPLIGR